MPLHKVYYTLMMACVAFQGTALATKGKNETLSILVESGASGVGIADAGDEADLLKWALKHSDPESLYKQAQAAKSGNKTDPDAAERRARAAELLHAVSEMPSESQLMEEAVLVLHNTSSTIQDKQAALEALIVLVEPIDNANHLLKIPTTTAELTRLLGSSPLLEAAAARVLGVAASNNALFSEALIKDHPDVILRLVQLLGAAADDTVAAAVYAAGSLLRNSGHARSLWEQASGGDVLLTMIRGGKQVSERSRKKALTLAGDLVLLDQDEKSNRNQGCSVFSKISDDDGAEMKGCAALVNVLLDVLEEQYKVVDGKRIDLDLVEKALLALQTAIAQQEISGGGGGENKKQTSDFNKIKDGAVLRNVIKQLRQGDKNGHVSEYEADVIALAEQLLKAQSFSNHRDEL